DSVLAQLGNRVQHALRAYTPSERKGVKAAAQSFRENPAFDTQSVITDLGVGEALVSTLDAKGIPGIVQRTLIRPPCSRLGPATAAERQELIATGPLAGRYEDPQDRESAYEILKQREKAAAEAARKAAEEDAKAKEEAEKAKARKKKRSSRQTPAEAAAKTFGTTIARELGKAIPYLLRGVLGGRRR
ncbi:MAG: helicase HerA-like domain-containing protein, partial [Pseudomonadota bacterium]